MSLPPPGNNVYWKEYEISTPTFRLTPIEKPDMSPFLIHMTGKNAIMGILRGENAENPVEEGLGFLRANVPEHSQGNYKAQVVCFTDSPTFALDFFRYRSFRRWQSDQRFGIGFDKANLVSKGVRPAIYADNSLVGNILHLYDAIEANDGDLADDGDINYHIVQMINAAYPLLFPLLEQGQQQGYMWEKEWRYPNAEGFTFSHTDVRVICCPVEEEAIIREILGEAGQNIEFIRAWREYDDVTDYLRRQQPIWREQTETVAQTQNDFERITQIQNLIQQYTIAFNSLTSYQDLISQLSLEEIRLREEKNNISEQLQTLQEELNNLEERKKEEDKQRRELNN